MHGKRLGSLERLSCGERLIIERHRLKETQEKAAQRFAVSSYTYGQWERDAEKGPERQCFSLTESERCLLYRRRAGLSQGKLASEMGRSRTWITQMERGLVPCKELIAYWEV